MYQHQFFLVNGRGFFAAEVVKTLVLYGEMEVVLRLCMVHGEALRSWWRVWQYYRMVSGHSRLMEERGRMCILMYWGGI